jgi:enoyl-CoA hydratase
MAKVLYEADSRIARITLNCPEVMNAIDDDLPVELAAAVARAAADPEVHVMVLSGNGRAFCGSQSGALPNHSQRNTKPPPKHP